MAYDLPTNESASGILNLFQYIQGISDGWFFVLILFAIFIIVFISLKNYTSSRAFAGAAFLNMILSVIMRTLGLISNQWMYLSIILVAVAAVWLHFDNSSNI